MNVKTTMVLTGMLLVCFLVYVGLVLQSVQNRYDASAAKLHECRGHRIEGTIGNDVVRLCVTAVP